MKLTTNSLIAAATAAFVIALAFVANVIVAPVALVALAAMPLVFLTNDYAQPRRGYLREQVVRHQQAAPRRHRLPLAA